MTAKEFVLQHFPDAECENEHPDYWIWSEPGKYKQLIGDSDSNEEDAWKDAKWCVKYVLENRPKLFGN